MSLWYKDAVFYELHVKAFQDGDGDGVGDFRGLVSRLDYLQEFGVDCIWLLPFYPSPLRDDGYDIADYRGVHPGYGTIDDVQDFLDESHRRGLRVIADLVLNHTSDQHAWFQRARRAPRDSPERDWYVWSDSDDRYQDARIIFTDTEPSNWTWDPVARQYYWHRFFAHQPDLNWDNPRVKEAMFEIMEFWLERGLDGFRADAVPYLIEREGTICENLPETHSILKEFRRRLDGRYQDRILLAEANQWPDDVRPYFGDSDEFHMAFHFPLMPRIFMAVRQGVRTPIVDIIEGTPAIPEECQWCMFLRNHDELTLEMVTDEERDYMYREYAADPRMRLNLGIRRRLAPLLDNDRRKIELLNSILFTMPGTPIVYYGDEIGMGDNIYLGDRDGVRTPMQWSADRNGGFSPADPADLYLPVIVDAVYGYQGLNVEVQSSSPISLLNWMGRLIQVRKAHHAFGRGTMEFLRPPNERILAYIREYEEDTVLVVHNLSGSAQPVALDLARFAGCLPLELLGHTEFPLIAEAPYPLTLSPYGFFWFAIRPPAATPTGADHDAAAAMIRAWATQDALLLSRSGVVAGFLAGLSAGWLARQRWFRSKTREIVSIERFDHAIVSPPDALQLLLAVVRVSFDTGNPENYLIPLMLRPSQGEEPVPVATIESTAGSGAVSLYDALANPTTATALVEIIARESEVNGAVGSFRGCHSGGWNDLSGSEQPIRPLEGEQTNTSIVLGERAILKIFRMLEPGVNPDLEISQFLLERTGFRALPALAGWIEYSDGEGVRAPVAGLYRYIPNRGDGWNHTLVSLDRFLNAVSRSAADPRSATGQTSLQRMTGDYLATASNLGTLTAELHLALASADPDDRNFSAEPIDSADVEAWIEGFQREEGLILDDLAGRLDRIPGGFPAEIQGDLSIVVRQAADLRERFDDIRLLVRAGASKIRVHGDYHLGQLLRAAEPGNVYSEWFVMDFEGEPARPLTARRAKQSPMRDLAGMLRSFDYATKVAIRRFDGSDDRTREAVRIWAAVWQDSVRDRFLRAYRERAGAANFLPRDDEAFFRVLTAFELQKAIYEMGYEMNNRPDWLWVPVQGIIAIGDRPA